MEVYYKPSDIVWVKLGSFWWPGEVVDKTNVPELLIESLKKEPVAIVKYFDDDGLYEVVKTPDRIFPYNCERKLDFIKKGMDAFRAKNPKLTSFPKDVTAAEIKTGGNANILSDPMFSTERKRNYAAEIFGTPTVKKPRESTKGRSIKSDPIITHRRFIGYDDYEARVLINPPQETPEPEVSPVERTNKIFTCPICQFTTATLGILTRHTSCHMRDVGFTSRQPIKKPQKRKRRKALSDDDLSEDEKKPKTKRRYTKKKSDESLLADDEKSETDTSVAKHKLKKKTTVPVVKEKKDICTDIIADWDDESNQEDSIEENTIESTLNDIQESIDFTRSQDSTFADSSFAFTDDDLQSTKISEEITEEIEKEKSNEDNKITDKGANKSCFDFEEDEEETKIPDATSGRKIPRVIPISERRKTFELDEVEDEEEKKKKKILEESEELAKLNEPSNDKDKETENLEKTYQSLMEDTENIELPDVPNILKNEQNFHSAKTVKYPDKPTEDSSDLVETEIIVVDNQEQKLEGVIEKVEKLVTVGENIETLEVVEDVTIEVDEKLPEPIEIDASEDKPEEEDTKQISTKGKRKRQTQYTMKSRRSTRSKPEAYIDAELSKHNTESEDLHEDEESNKIQVPLSVPSPSKEKEEEIEVEIIIAPEAEEIEVASEEVIEEKGDSEPLKEDKTSATQEIQKEESNLSNALEPLEKDVVQIETVVSAEEVTTVEVKDKQEDQEETLEAPKAEGPERVVKQQLEIGEENSKSESSKTVENSTEATVELIETTADEVAKTELNQTENKADEEESQPEPKRRKTTRGYAKTSKITDPSSQVTRRGRSRDIEMLKLEEPAKSSESKNEKEQQNSVPKRRSTRGERKLLKEEKETSHTTEEILSPNYEELTNVIIGKVVMKENVDVSDEDLIPLANLKQKSSVNKQETNQSAPIQVPSEVPTIEQDKVVEKVEGKENSPSADEPVVLKQKSEEPTNENKDQEISEKTDITTEERTEVDPNIEQNSSHRSLRRDKRSGRSDKDNQKDNSSKTDDTSSHSDSNRSLRGDSSSHKEANRSLRGGSSTRKEESSTQRETKRFLRGNSSSHREDDSSSQNESRRSLRGDSLLLKEDESSQKKGTSTHKESTRSLRGDSSTLKEEDSSLREDKPSQKEDSSTLQESKHSVSGESSIHREEDTSLSEDKPSQEEENKRSLRGDKSSHKEDNSSHIENKHSLRGDSSHKEHKSSPKEDSSSNKESKRSLRGDKFSHKEDQLIISGDNSIQKEQSFYHIESKRSLRGDSSHKEDNTCQKYDSSSLRESKRFLRGDKSSQKTDELAIREEKISQKEDSASLKESKRWLRGDKLSHKEDELAIREVKSSGKEDSSSQIEVKRSLRGDTSSRKEECSLVEDTSSQKEDSSFHKESKRSLRGDKSSNKVDDLSTKEDISSRKEDKSSHTESKCSFRAESSSYKEESSPMEDNSSHEEGKHCLRGEKSAHDEEERSTNKDNSPQKEDSCSEKESKRSPKADKTFHKEEDRSTSEDNSSQKEVKSSQIESKRSLRGDSSRQEGSSPMKEHKESKRFLRGDKSSHKEEDRSTKEDCSPQKEDKSSHITSKRSLRGDSSSRKEERSPMEDNSPQKTDCSSQKESKVFLRGDKSSHKEDRSTKDNKSFQKEDSSSQKESKRSLRAESSSRREEDRPLKEDKSSQKGESSSRKEHRRSLKDDKSFQKEDNYQKKEKFPHIENKLREDSSNKAESKRSLRGDKSSLNEDELAIKEDKSSQREGSKESKRSLRGDKSSHKEDYRSIKEDKSFQKEVTLSNRESKRLPRGDNSSSREDGHSHKEDNSSRKEDNVSQKGDNSSHKESKRSLREDNSFLKEDSSSFRSSRSGRRSSRQEREKQDSSDGVKTILPDESPMKHPKDTSSSRKSSSSRDSHSRRREIPTNKDQDDASRKSTKKDGKSSRTDQESQKHRAANKHELYDGKDQNSSSRNSRRHGRSSRNYPEDRETKVSSTPKEEDIFSLNTEKLQSSPNKSTMTPEKIDPIRALFSSETVTKTREQKREELKNIFSFDYDEEELKKRKTYSHKRKPKPTVAEKTSEPLVQTETNTAEISLETKEVSSLNSTEYLEPKVDETVIQSCSENIETIVENEQKLVTSELEVSKESSQKTGEEIERPKVVTVQKEVPSLLVENEIVPDVGSSLEVGASEDQNIIEEVVEIEVISEIQNNIVAEDDATKKIEENETKEDSKPEIKENDKPSTETIDEIESTVKSPRRKKPRKPSRWDKIEQTEVSNNQEQKIDILNTKKIMEENQLQNVEVEPTKEETIESRLEVFEAEPTRKAEESTVNTELTLGIDETSQKELNEIFSKKESSELDDKNAAQIELIFGSSPLPGVSENNIFIEKKEKLGTVDEKQELPHSSEEKKRDDIVIGEDISHNSSFEQSNDLLESVESQVARITHYEEPVPNEEKPQEQPKTSIFDTPEKKEKPICQEPDSFENKIDVESTSSSLTTGSKPEESSSFKQESTSMFIPKTKKTYLLSEQSKREMVENPPEKPTSIQALPIPPKTTEKTNEVATKLTNPKKRFVKSFEDSELNKKKEESLEAEKSSKTEVKTETSPLIGGKSLIAFKLKKQFLSKISNIFDEADKKKEIKILPKLKPIKHDSFIMKKKDTIEKVETATGSSNKEPSPSPKKTEMKETEVDVVTTEKEEAEDIKISPPENLDVCQETSKTDVQEVENLPTTDHSITEIEISSEDNSLSFPVASTESKPEESNIVNPIPAEPEDRQDDHIEVSTTEIVTKNFPLDDSKNEEPEYVSIDGNLTVVSEKELAEGQVEITASMPNKKPMTLLNFSMDFSDDSTDASFEAFKNEKIQGITESLDTKHVEEETEEKVKEVVEQPKTVEVKQTEQLVHEEKKEQVLEQQLENEIELKEEVIENKEETQETMIKVTNDFEIENISSIASTSELPTKQIENTETKKQEIHDISIDDLLKTSHPFKEEKVQPTDTEKEDVIDFFSSLSEPVKIVSKTPSESTSTKTKAKEPEKPVSSKKSERKIQSIAPQELPTVNEPLVIYNTAKSSTVTDMCDLEDHIPSQIVCTKNALINEDVMKVAGINNEVTKEATEPQMSKLLSRLTTDKKEDPMSKIKEKEAEAKSKELELKSAKVDPSSSKNLLKAAIKSKTIANITATHPPKPVNKAIILSEKIIRPARETSSAGSSTKRTYEDVEDIEPYVITKTPKLEIKKDETPVTSIQKISPPSLLAVNSPKQYGYNAANKQMVSVKKPSGKAKILNQTIIRPAGEAIQPKVVPEDNIDFDINSMPIVLSDDLLTPETLENMPIVLGEQAQKVTPVPENMKIVIEKKPQNSLKLATKTVAASQAVNSPNTVRMPIMKKTTPKILQTPKPTQKIIRQLTPSVSTKSPKFVVVSDTPNRPGQLIKKQTNVVRKSTLTTSTPSSTAGNSSESTGHKIMIFTNQQGKQQRLLLTPAQQKLFGMQVAGKTLMKTATAAQKSQLSKVQSSGLASTSKVSIQSPKMVKTTVGTTVGTPPQMKIVPPRKTQKVFMPGNQTTKTPQQKTIVISNQHGHLVRKIQGTNEALLEKQVAEQLEAIKTSTMKDQLKQHEARATKPTHGTRKAMVKRPEHKQTAVAPTKPSHQTSMTTSGSSRFVDHHVPPLTPLKQEKKVEEVSKQTPQPKPAQAKPERPLHQLVIQDNAGNQTTITEGQILALPSETVDGQPQSYMLVTLDETGNLTPLNNEALMSLDPSLAGLTGGDLSNMVLQMDAGASKGNLSQTAQLQAAPSTITQEKPKPEVQQLVVAPPKPVEQEQTAAQVQVTCNINGETGQQIILTGDPAATQKFLDSLSDGSTDLSNILAGAEGNSFLIQTDGQQILINTEPTEAPLLRHSTSIAEQPEHGSPMFSTHPVKNQDILAAALADTDVFQQDQVTQSKLHSQLSPGQTLFPMNVSNVLETSLTLNSPIMTPLEVPSTNSKRIPDEEIDILTTHVPKNVDLPITITDPNITQTVSHQQVLMASDLHSNLELTLPISETSLVTSGMNSPSFVYSLPSLDVAEHTEISQKSFGTSMPLLTEDIEESPAFSPLPRKIGDVQRSTSSSDVNTKNEDKQSVIESMDTGRMITTGGTFMEEGLCTLGAEMCSSLSEPPPEMFDIPMESDGINFLNKTQNESKEKSDPVNSSMLMEDNSLEMPVQSRIEFKDSSDSSSSASQDKTL